MQHRMFMRHVKTSFAISAAYLTLGIFLIALCLSARTFGGYLLAIIPLIFTSYEVYRVYRKLQLYNHGRPLTPEQEKLRQQLRSQKHGYQRYNLYHKWYRFADATEQEYLAEKIHETAKKVRRK